MRNSNYTRQLTLAGARLTVARGQVKDALREVKSEIKIAHENGMSISEIARRAGVTRQTVYDILRSDD